MDQLYACVCVCVRVEPRDSGGFTSDPSTPRQTSDKMRKEGEGRRESRINAEEAKRERGNLKREAVNEGESGVNLKMTGGEGEARGGGGERAFCPDPRREAKNKT